VSRTVVLTATVVVALVAACLALVVVVVKPAEGAFPGKNGKIAFAGIRPSDTETTNNWEIYTTYPDSFKPVNITKSPSIDVMPAWSPNGKKIAYERYLNGSRDIYVMNANGSTKRRLTDSSGDEFSPAWSSDGSKIAFQRNLDIYIMDANGGNVRRLTNNTRHNANPSWSPDGTKIAFQSTLPGIDDWEIYTINVDGTGEKALTNNQIGVGNPDWSPDGQRIVFEGGYQASDAIYNAIYVVNADGSNVEYLRNGGNPFWSPDGRRIGLVIDGPNEIASMNPDGNDLTFLTTTPDLIVRWPDWQPRP
jgi:Tol biopolymer transport system component